MPEQLYYMQDKRQYVGNSMLWWAKEDRGYTCDIKNARLFTMAEAKERTHRETDILWPQKYIEARISHHIDMQHCCENGNAISMAALQAEVEFNDENEQGDKVDV